MTDTTPKYVVADVGTTTDLPAGWTWWDHPGDTEPDRRRTYTRVTLPDAEPVLGPDVTLLDDTPTRRYVRSLGFQDLSDACDRAVATWMDESGSGVGGDMVAALPDGWRSFALRRLGYSAHGHADLLAIEATDVETSLQQSVSTPEEAERYTWMSDKPWDARDYWRTQVVAAPPARVVRLARAVAGTPLPAGWAEHKGGFLAQFAPLDMSSAEAVHGYLAATHTRNTTIIVSDTLDPHGRVLVWRGMGGEAHQIGGAWSDRPSAVKAALERLTADREPHRWVPNLPAVAIISARSPGWEAVRLAEDRAKLAPSGADLGLER